MKNRDKFRYMECWDYCELVEEEIDQLLKGGDVIDH